MYLFYVNKVDEATLMASTENPDYLAENVQKQHLTEIWRPTVLTDQWIKMNTGAFTPEGAFIAGHNLSESAVVKIQGNDTDTWGSPAVDITMIRANGCYFATAGFSEQDYWRYSVSDPGNADGYIAIGRMWLGVQLEIYGPATDFTEDEDDTTNTDTSVTGQSYSDLGYIYRLYDMSYPYNENTDKDSIKAFYAAVRISVAFFTIFAPGYESELSPLYGRLTQPLSYVHIMELESWAVKMSFREEK